MFYTFNGKGGKTAEIFYSLIGTCKLNAINPYEYLKDVMACINAHPASKIGEPLLGAWQEGAGRKG